MEIKTLKLTNKNGMTVTVTNMGLAIMKIQIPTNIHLHDVVLGFDTAEEYKTREHPSFGVVAGRMANRIDGGRFTLSGKEYQLEKNDGGLHHLHGGKNGFSSKIWDIEYESDKKIVFTLDSPDSDSGYPGNLFARVTYALNDENVLRMEYETSTDTETICNLTNHSYFNLDGVHETTVYKHELMINADKITPVNELLIPTGEFEDVKNTKFDFTSSKCIGKNFTGGYDHNFVLREKGLAAVVYSPKTGIKLSVFTDSPGIQLYTGNFLDGTISGKGKTYVQHSGFCLETQLFPDSINQKNFSSPIVTKDNPQKHYTEYKFEWRADYNEWLHRD